MGVRGVFPPGEDRRADEWVLAALLFMLAEWDDMSNASNRFGMSKGRCGVRSHWFETTADGVRVQDARPTFDISGLEKACGRRWPADWGKWRRDQRDGDVLCASPLLQQSLRSVSNREGGRGDRRPTTIKTMTGVGRNETRREDGWRIGGSHYKECKKIAGRRRMDKSG